MCQAGANHPPPLSPPLPPFRSPFFHSFTLAQDTISNLLQLVKGLGFALEAEEVGQGVLNSRNRRSLF